MSRQYFLDFTEVAHVSQHCDLYCTAPVCRLGCRLPGQPNTWCCRAAWEPDKLESRRLNINSNPLEIQAVQKLSERICTATSSFVRSSPDICNGTPGLPRTVGRHCSSRVTVTDGMSAPAIGPGPGTQHPSDSWHVTKSHCYAVRVTVPGHTVKSIDWAPASGTTVTLPQAKGPESSRTKNQEVRTILFLFLPIH